MGLHFIALAGAWQLRPHVLFFISDGANEILVAYPRGS
jgi:hypothetical protein